MAALQSSNWQCQDEFLHCTNCGLDQERINITFRWIKQHVASRVLLANVCAGFIRPCYGVGRERRVLGFWVLLGILCVWCQLCWFIPSCPQDPGRHAPPLGGGRWGHFLRDPRRVDWFAQKCPIFVQGHGSDSICVMPCMLASVGQPSLQGYDACMVYWIKGALRGNCRLNLRTVPPDTHSNDFGSFSELFSRFEFDFRRCDFFERFDFFGVFKVQPHATRLSMCMCFGLLTPTQFHFECCGVFDDSRSR